MPNPQYQFGAEKGPDPKLAGKKGGKVSSLKKRWGKITKCTPRCPFYDKCRFVSLSKEKFNGYCAVKQFPKTLSDRIFRWMKGDEDAWIDNIVDYIIKTETNIDTTNDPKLQLQFLRVVKEIYQTIFGNKVKLEANVNTLSPEEILNTIEKQLEEVKKGGIKK